MESLKHNLYESWYLFRKFKIEETDIYQTEETNIYQLDICTIKYIFANDRELSVTKSCISKLNVAEPKFIVTNYSEPHEGMK